MSNSIGVRSTVWPHFKTWRCCGAISNGPKRSGSSEETAIVEKSVIDARANTALLKSILSVSSKDRIINFPCRFPPLNKRKQKKLYIIKSQKELQLVDRFCNRHIAYPLGWRIGSQERCRKIEQNDDTEQRYW